MPLSRPPAFKLCRWCTAFGWLAWLLSIALLWGQHTAGVLHPAPLLLSLLLVVAIVAAMIGTAGALRRLIRGPQRRGAFAWALVCVLPLGFWAGLATYTLRQSASGETFSKNIFSDIALVGVASLMEGQIQLAYPHRLESERLVMFYDERVTDPQKDLETMDRHVATLEAAIGKSLRAKIHWVRGEVFGRRQFAIRGLVFGSSQSPANQDRADHPFRLSVDRHELAHGVIHQFQPANSDPPTLLIEGWAEAHSGMTTQKRAELAKHSRRMWIDQSGAGPSDSYLRELSGANWYHRIDGPVYSVGGVFAEFVVEKYGIKSFLTL